MSADGVPFFTNLQCEAALPWKELTDQLEVGLSRFSKGDIEQPVRVALTVPELGSFVGLMPCYSKADNVISCKIVCVYPQNTQKGISSHIVYVLLFDATTGNLRAFMEGESITKRRTAATSALSARWLAPENPKVLAILGAGHQALAHMQVLLQQYPSLMKINLWNHRSSSAIKLAEEVSGWLKAGQQMQVFQQVEDCIAEANLIVTATFAIKPVLMDAPKESCHIMAVGAPRPDWSEIDPQVWRASKVYVDSFAGAQAESGDILNAQCQIENELGNIIGETHQRSTDRTIFKSLGLAIEDLVGGKMVVDQSQGFLSWPVTFYDANQVKALMLEIDTPLSDLVLSRAGTVFNQVTNFECQAFILTAETLVCETKTNSSRLGLIYFKETGELLAVLDMKDVGDELVRNRIYAKVYENLK